MVKNVIQTYYGDHFIVYANLDSFCYTPETKIMLYVNYTPIKMYIHTYTDKIHKIQRTLRKTLQTARINILSKCLSMFKYLMKLQISTCRNINTF